MERENGELKVTMLGGFAIEWQGREISISRNTAPKFLQLMQMVWLYGERGLERGQIVRDLYEGRTLASPANSINNLLLQARHHFAEAGLPDCSYVVHRRQVCYPDPEIPVSCDAEQFHALVKQARAAAPDEHTGETASSGRTSGAAAPTAARGKENAVSAGRGAAETAVPSSTLDGDAKDTAAAAAESIRLPGQPEDTAREQALQEQERLYREAFSLYQGRFLPEIADRQWVEREAGFLTREYIETVDFLVRRMAARGERREAERLYRKACRTETSLTEDSFGRLLSGRNLNLNAEKEMDSVGVIGARLRDSSPAGQDADETQPVQEEMSGYRPTFSLLFPTGACNCSWQSFCDIVRMFSSNMERAGISACLVQLNLVDYKGTPIDNPEKRSARMRILRDCIETSLRSGDALTQYGDSAYLALMIGYDGRERARVLRSIRTSLREQEGTKARVLSSEMSLAEL